MKKFYLLTAAAFVFILGFSSDNINAGNYGSKNITSTNIIDHIPAFSIDSIDTFSFNMDYDAAIGGYVSLTNNNATGKHEFKFELFSATSEVLLYSRIITGDSIAAGASLYENFRLCGMASDSIMFVFHHNGDFTYYYSWYEDDETIGDGNNNNNFATAEFFTPSAQKEAIINYNYQNIPNWDTVDYFKTTLPAADYDSVSLFVKARNNSCENGKWLQYFLYKNGSTIPFSSGYVSNNTSIDYNDTYNFHDAHSKISLSGMQQGDELIIRFISNGAFSYKMQLKNHTYQDAEPNEELYQAILLPLNTEKKGSLGAQNPEGGFWVYDELDVYKIIPPHDGTFRLYATAINDSCSNSNWNNSNYIDYYLYDKTRGNGKFLGEAWWDDPVICGDMRFDTLTKKAVLGDTLILYLWGDSPASYTLRYEMIDSTSGDVEPNNTQATAIPISEAEVKKGHLGFYRSNPQDLDDYYKTTLPVQSSIKVFVKATYLGDNTSNTVTNRLRLTLPGVNSTTYSLPASGTITTDGNYIDSFKICDIAAGDVYFRLQVQSNSRPYEYEIWYEVDTIDMAGDIEPNNNFSESKYIASNQTYTQFLGGDYDDQQDIHDYHKMVFKGSDSLTLHFKATNIGCANDKWFRIYGYNKTFHFVFFKGYILNGGGIIDAGETVQDSIKYLVPGADTIYVRFESNGDFQYSFRTNPLPPTSSFTIVGDTTACEGPAYEYKAINVADSNVVYHWSLPLGGGTLSYTDSVATVVWNESAIKKIQLHLSNNVGISNTKGLEVIVDGTAPTQVPVVYNFARTLSTNSLPPGNTCQWFKDGIAISGATDSTYYAADAGGFSVKFVNDCGEGPESNIISFPQPAQPQTITFSVIDSVQLTPSLKLPLTAIASSGLPVYYQIVSGPATVVNDSLRITQAGTIIIKARQPGDDFYSAASEIFDTVIVVKGDQVITFDAITDKIFSPSARFPLIATSSVGTTVNFTVVSGNAVVDNQRRLVMQGVGTVTVRAYQNGNNNYNAAQFVERTFCIGIRELAPISGEAGPCLATYKYTTTKAPGANYQWTLSGGGILTTNNDTAFVQWQTPGTYTLKVKANGNCDTAYNNEQEIIITTSDDAPAPVSNMLPINNAIDQQLPLKLSWIPGSHTVTYDLYVWDSAGTEPVTPFAADLTTISYTLPKNSLAYNTTYKWRIVSKNPCSQTSGSVQHFRLIPLADLEVTEVFAPTSANSGQTVTVSWKITNVGPGKTLTHQSWTDAVFFSYDTVAVFGGNVNFNPSTWSAFSTPLLPLMIANKQNVSALNPGESYTNSADFTIPVNYSQPIYVYVYTTYNNNINVPLQVTVINDTARATNTIDVTLSPTPDLRVDTVFAPTTTFSGSTIDLTYKVKNYGVLTPVGSSWVDSIFISQSPLFDRSTAIPINRPKVDGSYYPDAREAATSNSVQLQPDSTYTRNLKVVIPNEIFGTWFIYVQTNGNKKLYEGAFANNNFNRTQLSVYLTPTPKLIVKTLDVPVTSASTTQPFGVNWQIFNEGFRDNIHKNRGHYFKHGSCTVPCGPGAPPNSICIATSITHDSLVFGSSYWLDRVYLSTDPSGLNLANAVLVKETAHGAQFSGIYPNISYCPATALNTLNVKHEIKPGSTFPSTTNFNIPSDLPQGNYYVYVATNVTKTVFEYPGNLQVKRSNLPVMVKRPDLTVPVVNAPSSVSGGQTFTIEYTVQNVGQGSVFNHTRHDRIYRSIWPVFDANAELIETKTYIEDIPFRGSVTHTYNYAFPHSTSGNRYIYVQTNYDSLFKETNMNNNVSTASTISVTAAVPNDLVVNSVSLADTIFSIFSQPFQYTVTNNGNGTTSGTWTDSLFISCSPVFDTSSSYFIAARKQTRSVGNGQNYSDTFNINIPYTYEINACFPETKYTTAYFFIKTNADTAVYEASSLNNNITGSGSKIVVNPLVDHIVTTVAGADTATVGRNYGAQWTIKNIGYNPNIGAQYHFWNDAVIISTDSVINANSVIVQLFTNYRTLQRNDSVKWSSNVVIPNVPTGDYYLLVNTNFNDNIKAEKEKDNNLNLIRDASGVPKKIHIIRPLLPDFVDSIIVAPTSVALGQPFTLIHKVTNKGPGATYPTRWESQIVLSNDFVPTNADRTLNNRTHLKVLQPNEHILDTVTALIPMNTEVGNYVIISHPNSNNLVIESNSANNLAFSLLDVYSPPPTDLTVISIDKPDTVYLGYTIDTLRWIVENASPNTASGISKDGVYLTKKSIVDSTAVLVGIKDKTLKMLPLSKDTLAFAPLVNNVVEGEYNLIVRTDLLNNIVESDKDNNTTLSLTPIYVKVKELPLNITESNTLKNLDRYYKLIIPDSLLGSTIRVSLRTGDSLTMRNEMFIGGGYIPSPAQFDYKFERPNYGNQHIVMTSVYESVYYIVVRSVSPNPVEQNITLHAEKLPFAILNVQSSSGGNIGNVTVKISGSLFESGMTATLSNAGDTINSSAVYFTNSTIVYATFNLQGKTLGQYHVTLFKDDTTAAVLQNSFSIVTANNGGLITGGGFNTGPGNGTEPGCDPGAESGLNSQLVVELVVPPVALLGRPILLQINYSNPTNFDIPAQARTLYGEAGIKFAFTQAGVATGTDALYLELTEPGGPPGILRAGASGTVTVYTVAPKQMPVDPRILFKLK